MSRAAGLRQADITRVVKGFCAAGVPGDLHFHDLRGTAVTRLSEAGCSVPEICSITGHSLQSATRILEVYLSRTEALSTGAISKLEAHRNSKR